MSTQNMTNMTYPSISFSRYFPIVNWLKGYDRQDFSSDVFAGIITAILLVPQGIAYAILAGLPPQLGLYASILPPALYALLGTSRTLSVGPVSIAAIMIASALSAPEVSALGDPVQSSLILSAESGIIMLMMAMLRMGSLVHFISHPVLAGFTSGAALLIIANQLPQLAGLKTPSCGLDVDSYRTYLAGFNNATLLISGGALALLMFFGKPVTTLLKKARVNLTLTTAISKCGPLLTVVAATLAVSFFDLGQQHVALVGKVPAGMPELHVDFLNADKWRVLLPFSAFIALIAYVESVAIAKVTANLRGQKIIPNQELIGLGVANLAAAITGGMPVAGGFSRTMVNFSAGARTQMSMLIAAFILLLSVIFFSPWFEQIPKAALAAIILMAIYRLVRVRHIINTWNFDRGDGIAELVTLVGVLVLGIEEGITLGIILTIGSQLRKNSQPNIAVVNNSPQDNDATHNLPGSVAMWHHLLLVRIDESITFANIHSIEDYLETELKRQPNTRHVVLICTSVNDIDATALEALGHFNHSLQLNGQSLNISEAKGKVLEKLQKTDFLEQIKPGKVFVRTEDAAKELG
ncbi:solute carrier family 26 protein [Methylosoma difficile]